MIKLLLIEDDESQCFLIKDGLENIIKGYEVTVASNGKDGLSIFAQTIFDIIVADIEMPVIDGLTMVKKIKMENNHVPVIIVSARKLPNDVITGYEAGANNYLKKPVYPEELDVHIKELLKRKQMPIEINKEIIYELGNYTFNPRQYYLAYQSNRKKLTYLESNLLDFLCENMGKVVPRTSMYEKFWPEKEINDAYKSRRLDVLVNTLRNYLIADNSVSITTHRKIGLCLEVKK